MADNTNIEMISIIKKEYDQLIEDQKWLRALESNNFEEYDLSRKFFRED